MKIILKDDVEKVGRCGEVVSVKKGFARNFLFPRQLAVPASAGLLRSIDQITHQKTQRDRKRLKEAERIKMGIERVSLEAQVQVGEEDRVFGSVTSAALAELLRAQGFDIDRRNILLDEPLKALGVYTVDVKIEQGVVAHLKVWVVKKAGDAGSEG